MGAEWVWIKAQLICHGWIQPLTQIPKSLISRSSAGPDSGLETICLGYKSSGVRLALSWNPGRYQLAPGDSGWRILEDGAQLICGIKLLPKLAHTYNQIFVNLDPRCKYSCRFCSLTGAAPKFDFRGLLEFVKQNPGFPIALTCGIPDDEFSTTSRICELVKQLRRITDQPIGVEHLVTHLAGLEELYSAGVDELKLNLGFINPERFNQFCPELDQRRILNALAEAADIFGKNRVCSNLFLGAGEDPLELIQGMRMLAEWGVVPNLRLLRITPANRTKLESILAPARARYRQPWYLIGMGIAQKRILAKYGLDPREFATMCFSCRLCDLIPFVDF